MLKRIRAFCDSWAALTLSDTFLLDVLNLNGYNVVSGFLSPILLYGAVLLGLIVILNEKTKIIPAIIISLIIILIGQYEKSIISNVVMEFLDRFIIHSIGGCIIGLSISDYKSFFKYLGWISCVYGVFLITEPVTHSLLPDGNAMTTGYMMSPLVIWIFTARTLGVIPKYTLVVGIPLAISTVIFTSRGCGLSVLAALLLMYYYKIGMKANVFKMILAVIGLYIACELFLSFFSSYGAMMEHGQGSLLEKTAHGYAESDNGREEIWQVGLQMISNNWLQGTGIAMDRAYGGYVFLHNIFLEIFVHFGLPLGLLLLISYWGCYFYGYRKMKSLEPRFVLLMLVCVYWIKLMFSDSYLSNMLGIMFLLGLSISLRVEEMQRN